MTHPHISQLAAAEYHQRRAAAAARNRLAALASCCRPARLIAAVRALNAQLTAATRPAGCCA